MRFNTITLALLAAVPAFASPLNSIGTATTEPSTNVLVARQQGPQATQCGSHAYTAANIADAYNLGMTLTMNNQKIKGSNKKNYPATFNNYEGITLPDCVGVPAPFLEFPVLRTGSLFKKDDSPDLDRVIYKQAGPGGPIQFCGADTHEGADPTKKNAVVSCSAVPAPPPPVGPAAAAAPLAQPQTS